MPAWAEHEFIHGIVMSTCETTTELARAWTHAHQCGIRGICLAGTMRHPLSIPRMYTIIEDSRAVSSSLVPCQVPETRTENSSAAVRSSAAPQALCLLSPCLLVSFHVRGSLTPLSVLQQTHGLRHGPYYLETLSRDELVRKWDKGAQASYHRHKSAPRIPCGLACMDRHNLSASLPSNELIHSAAAAQGC